MLFSVSKFLNVSFPKNIRLAWITFYTDILRKNSVKNVCISIPNCHPEKIQTDRFWFVFKSSDPFFDACRELQQKQFRKITILKTYHPNKIQNISPPIQATYLNPQ